MTKNELAREIEQRCRKAVNNDLRRTNSIEIQTMLIIQWHDETEERFAKLEKALKSFCKKYDTNNEIMNFYKENK